MNYTFVLNLLKKQINHLIKIMLEIRDNVNNKCEMLNTFIEDIETSKIQKVGESNRHLTFFVDWLHVRSPCLKLLVEIFFLF